jgi:hypothetical protein
MSRHYCSHLISFPIQRFNSSFTTLHWIQENESNMETELSLKNYKLENYCGAEHTARKTV